MRYTVFQRLVRRRLLTDDELDRIIGEAAGSTRAIEDRLRERGIPKHELLHALTEAYHLPYAEFDESVIVSQQVMRRVDAERLKERLWFPLSIGPDSAQVIACDPGDPDIRADVTGTLGVAQVDFLAALPSDLVRIIEHNQDLNPAFPPAAGRTPLAKVRTFLADRRSLHACTRTTLARGRTGLALLRTGMSFIAISVALLKLFGIGRVSYLQAPLFLSGLLMVVDGFRRYLPARRSAKQQPEPWHFPEAGGTTVLAASWSGEAPLFARSAAVPGASELRSGWNGLSPVMRRRFLANDRTDLAEERTMLAGVRTRMARARTGLAFTRTGIAFIGLGIALLRFDKLHGLFWTGFEAALVLLGAMAILEGFWWYLPGRAAGAAGLASVRTSADRPNIWESLFPPAHERPEGSGLSCRPRMTATQAPGIWATTGLALERTVLAERRNVMARLRTIMARSRTGLALIRTGMSISAVGAGLLVFFSGSASAWTALDGILVCTGMLFIADGLYWHLPADRTRRQFPYCFCDLEIAVPDYGRPSHQWPKAVFSHDDL